MSIFRTARQVASLPNLVQPQVEAWTTSNLDSLVWADVFGTAAVPLSRAGAMAVPAVARARHLICSAVGKLPLTALRGAALVEPQPYWTVGTDGQLGDVRGPERRRMGLSAESPWARMVGTVDDLIFHGWSLWLATKLDADGRPLRLAHVPYDGWDVDDEPGRDAVLIDPDGVPIPSERVRLIQGPHEGILSFARRSIGIAADLERAVADQASHPLKIELHQTTDVDLTPEEKRELIDQARQAMRDNDGVLFTNNALETKDHAVYAEQLLIAGRNASAVDIARHVSIPAAMLDATSVGASLEYATLTGRNAQFIDYGIALYADAIAARLSMDDVVPAGQRVALDLTELTAPSVTPSGAPTGD